VDIVKAHVRLNTMIAYLEANVSTTVVATEACSAATAVVVKHFAQLGVIFLEPVPLCRTSHPRIDAVGRPGPGVYDGVVGQCDRIENCQFKAGLPALGNFNRRWLWIGEVLAN
jgi:hypothetical protein